MLIDVSCSLSRYDPAGTPLFMPSVVVGSRGMHTDWIGERFVSDLGTSLLADLAEIGPRLGASEGERRGHERVRRAFETAGVRDVELQEFDLTKWERDDARVELTEPTERTFDPIALPGSPSGTVEAEFVHLGYGLPADFEDADLEGTVVVTRSDVPDYHDRWMHRREKYFRAVDAGAAAFLFQNHVEGQLPPTGSVGGGTDVVGPIPAAGVSYEAGERLARYDSEGSVRGTITVETEISDGTSQNVVGVLGPDTDEEIVLCGHVDGHDISEGALDNASGIAVVCEAAAGLAAVEDALERRVRVIGFGAEELGLKGSQHYLETTDPSTVTAVVNCDGVGRGRDMSVRTCGFGDLGTVVEEVATEFDHPIEAVPRVSTHSDQWPFVWRGVPGLAVGSDTGPGRGWGHTAADTLDKTDERAIREHGILVARIVQLLADAERTIDRRDPEAIRDELVAEKQDVSMRVAGEWPFDD